MPAGVYTQAGGVFTQEAINDLNLALQLPFTTGSVYYLDPANGNDLNVGTSPSTAVATLATGYALLASGKNDVLLLIGNGLATGSARLSANFTWSKNAAHLIGVSSSTPFSPRARIATTLHTAAFANFFTVSGSGCLFSGIEFFHGFDTGVAAEICVTVTGLRNTFYRCALSGMGDSTGAGDAGSRNLLISGGGENWFNQCTIGIDTVARTNANASVEFKGGTARNVFDKCIFPFLSTDGLQYVGYGAAAGWGDRFQIFRNCTIENAILSSSTALAGGFALAAPGGGPNGGIYLENCNSVGMTEWVSGTSGDTLLYVAGPAVNNAMGIAVTSAT